MVACSESFETRHGEISFFQMRGGSAMRMKATIEVQFEAHENLDDIVLRAALFRGVSELEKAIKQGVLGGSPIGIKWVKAKICNTEVLDVPQGP
jgi:hypothetical protein